MSSTLGRFTAGVVALGAILGACGTALGQLTILSTTPTPNENTASVDGAIIVNFDRSLDAATVTNLSFHVFGKVSGVVPTSIQFHSENSSAMLVPFRRFSCGELVTVVISHHLRGADGAQMQRGGYTFQFYVRAEPAAMLFHRVQVLNDRFPGEGTTRAYGAQASDLNRDAWPDLTVVNEVSADLRVFLSRGAGDCSFHPFLTPTQPNEVEASPNDAADFNFDGIVDIVTSNTQNGSVSVHLGNGDGTFRPRQTIDAGDESHGVALLDVDGDGDIDIVNANSTSNNLAMFINDGGGVFSKPTFFDGGGNGEYALAAADMTNDGIMDLVVGNRNSATVSVMRGNGNGTFTAISSRAAGGAPWQIAVGDLNGDQIIDVAFGNGGSHNGSILLGNGDGSLRAPQTVQMSPNVVSSDLADLDGDGDLDWVLASFAGGEWRVFENDGKGNFTLYQVFEAPAAASCSVLADFDLDGDVDMALIDEIADTIDIYQNACRGDWNGDRIVNSQDFFDFLEGFFTNGADFNGDGVTNSQDFFDYLEAFFTAC